MYVCVFTGVHTGRFSINNSWTTQGPKLGPRFLYHC